VFAILALACVLVQEAPKRTVDEGALYEALIRKTNDLKAFVATYRAKAKDTDESLRIAYHSPGEFQVAGLGMHMTARDGILTALTPSSWARLDFGALVDRRSKIVADAIATEFIAQRGSWESGISFGPILQVELPVVDDGKHDQFDFTISYACPQGALLDWIESFKRSDEVSVSDDEHRVLKTPRGSRLTLSMRTGFVESMKREDDRGTATIELESLDLNPEFGDKTFEPAARPEGVEDKSAEFAVAMEQTVTLELLRKIGVWISAQADSRAIKWSSDIKAHAGRLLETVLGDAITSETRAWQSKTREWTDGLYAWMRATQQRDALTGDGSASAIEESIRKARERLAHSLKGYEEWRPPSPFYGSKLVPDSELRTSLNELIDDAWTEAFARVLNDPMLKAFDEAVSKAKAGG
jgi:hypothetical protein